MNQHKTESGDAGDALRFDLMFKRATQGLEPEEQRELDRFPDHLQTTARQIELVVTALELARVQAAPGRMQDELPAGLRNRLAEDAARYFGASGRRAGPPLKQALAQTAPADSAVTAASRPHPTRDTRPDRRSSLSPVTRREILAMLITAASLLLVFSGRNPLAFNATDSVGDRQPPMVAVKPTADQQLATLLAAAPADLIQLPWKPVMDPDAGGSVVWSDQRQEGYMVFTGMKFNDPAVEQYQLWIFDNDPAQAAPPSGGVFDLSDAMADANGRIVVPIQPYVPIGKAVQFAITVETPGGVYQSKREKLPVLASLN